MEKSAGAILLAYLFLVLPGTAQQPAPAPDWSAWGPVMGDWIGDASGTPGQGTGSFNFAPDLQGRILVRRSRTVFPSGPSQPANTHDDLLVCYYEGNAAKAVYWDNEGHVIHYEVSLAADRSIVFVSGKSPGAFRQRLSYRPLGDGRLIIRFDIAPPDKPDEFKVHVEGTAHKK